MRVGWISPTIGCFGAVREIVEVSNVLVRKKHKVYIYHPEGTACKWLTCAAECRKLSSLVQDSLDVLIGVVDWQPELYNDLLQANAKVKAICLLGFTPSDEMAQALRGEITPRDEAERIILDAIERKFLLLADSSWQIDWIKEKVGYDHVGPSFGGINLSMFKPDIQKFSGKYKIIYSGDPRERKGTDTVEKAIKILKSKNINAEYASYWGKKFSQEELVKFIQSGHIFLDGHRRAGWCNPVAEAIACGTVPICTNIGANQDFSIHEETALVVPVDNPEAMAQAALRFIDKDNLPLRNHLRLKGLEQIQKFSYEKVVPHLEAALESRI